MYYPNNSPAIQTKLPNDPWQRSHLQLPQPQNVGPPPTSPGYPLYPHPLSHPTLHQHPHHQNHYPSPPSLQPHVLAQGSPASVPGQPMTQHWQQQLLKCEMIRSSRSPHHRARASAMASRNVTKSAIPITNPNAVKSPEQQPANRDSTATPLSESTNGTALDHPSSTVAPVAEAPRQSSSRPPDHVWTALDMGGINIKNLPPTSGLFSFSFLINLYLNHNALTSIPPEIAQLRHLELLDLSGNALETLPPEIGMLVNLKEFYIFDNRIQILPPELGTLHQLQTLGIEGNPLDVFVKSLVQKDGTAALISHLRDTCPPPPEPPARPWHSYPDSDLSASETFSVICSNILCEKYATERLYGYTPQWALSWEYRKELILSDLRNYDADFICLQEVDIGQYEDYFTKNLSENGYTGIYWPKGRAKNLSEHDRRRVDGCATFYKSHKFQLIESHLVDYSACAMQRSDFKKTDDMFNRVLGKDHIATICLFENKFTGTRIVVANTHIIWDPNYADVKLVQTALLIQEIEKCVDEFASFPPRRLEEMEDDDEENDVSSSAATGLQTPPPGLGSRTPSRSSKRRTNGYSKTRKAPTYSDGTKIPVIVAGDFNSVPSSGVYEFLSNGTLSKDHEDLKGHLYGKYTSEGMKHKLGLRSAYYMGPGGVPTTAGAQKVDGAGGSHANGTTSGVNGVQTNGINGHTNGSGSSTPSSVTKVKQTSSNSSIPAYRIPGTPESNELLRLTNYTPSYQGVLDYIWYSSGNLGVNAVLGNVDEKYLEKVVGFPNAHFPSE
ncbi:hypothetical protein K435DRAFT_799104 [Dendrothele bispora CBS 962.96]|uniref:CCR4-Not complex 3'-5'-exoribonuclease subunit Ccr4 n=1 Tax=Dendrothele bispora (strain CBS 962.96) TaxID=1314807 RepID=A0A4S8LWX2_DENBC|nr:hypothetical protein K435DRAFT_799104 [Dendrothele bispora CBS 962.96]